ncbi:UNVERIFIED_CONTAM: hypothetical protein PYX00_001542 [Menopon gallinae]|uniref:Uncharacterized protein n=1 Tax=Menopon gallinae TaxID=328185 RepID=A0AAW2IDE8_9NEOP
MSANDSNVAALASIKSDTRLLEPLDPDGFVQKEKKDIDPLKIKAGINVLKKINLDTLLVVSPALADINKYKNQKHKDSIREEIEP